MCVAGAVSEGEVRAGADGAGCRELFTLREVGALEAPLWWLLRGGQTVGDQGGNRRTRAEGTDLVQVSDNGAHQGRSHGGSKK